MRLKLLGLLLVTGAALSSCKKNDEINSIVTDRISEIKAPANFTWSGSRDVNISVGITDNSAGGQYHVIKIYSADPSKGGELISSGSATQILPFNSKFALSSMVKEVYIEKIAPSGAVIGKAVSLTSDNMSVAISASTVTPSISSVGFLKRKLSVVNEPTPTVPNGATEIFSNNNYVNLPGNTTYVIKSNATVYFNAFGQNAIVYIDGTNINVGGIQFDNNLTVIVTAGSTVKFTGSFNWNTAATFKNFGTVQEITNSISLKGGVFRNQGSLVVKGNLSVDGGTPTTLYNTGSMEMAGGSNFRGVFENSGSVVLKEAPTFDTGSQFTNQAGGTLTIQGSNWVTIKGTFTNEGTVLINNNGISANADNPTFVNSGTFTANNAELILIGTFTNNGTVTVRQLTVNSGGKVYNNCKWFVTSTTQWINTWDGLVENSSYFKVSGGLTVNSSGKIRLKNGSLFITNWVNTLDSKAEGTGSTSVFKINNSFVNPQNYSSARFNGALHVVAPATLPTVFFENGAQQKASGETVSIPVGDCMLEGSGPLENTDPDGDGIHGTADAYPNDPNKAFNNYSENYFGAAGGGSTIAFEDSWPLKGDYDLNDVVINYKYKVITNAANKVVRVEANYLLLATGGEFQNGAGIEFPIVASKATNFSGPTGTSLESGQAKVVVILFQNSRAEQATWNTQTGQNVSPSKAYAIGFDVTDGPSFGDFGVNVFNPFIWNASAGFGRKYETHLFGKTPTTLATNAPFKTGDDDTGGSKYYGTVNNLPWAIQVPIANFVYPLERVPITDGYKLFSNWATNGGTQSTDWYIGTSSVYRDDTKLYITN